MLHSNFTNSTVVASALSLYIDLITNSYTTLNSTYTLTIEEIDTYLGSINNINYSKNGIDSFLLAKPPNEDVNNTVLGASFTSSIGGEVVDSSNIDKVTNSTLSVAAIVSNPSLTDVTSLHMLIINKPSSFINVDNSTNKKLASPIIIATVRRNNSLSPVNISLYFRIIPAYRPNVPATYLCSFYDANTLKWNESGCTVPQYNQQFDRYECSCNHLSTFALVWLPYTISCNTSPHVQLPDGTCVSKSDGQV